MDIEQTKVGAITRGAFEAMYGQFESSGGQMSVNRVETGAVQG